MLNGGIRFFSIFTPILSIVYAEKYDLYVYKKKFNSLGIIQQF